MIIRVSAIVAIVIIVISSLLAITINPDSLTDVLQIVSPTLIGLMVLIQVKEYHTAVNSKMDAYIKLVETAAKAEGKLEESESVKRS